MEAAQPSKAVLGMASNRQRWSAGDRTGKILARIKGRIEIISEQWPSFPREPLDMPVGLNARKRPADVIGNATHEAMRWVDHHPLQAFAIILTVISLFYLLVGGFVGRV